MAIGNQRPRNIFDGRSIVQVNLEFRTFGKSRHHKTTAHGIVGAYHSTQVQVFRKCTLQSLRQRGNLRFFAKNGNFGSERNHSEQAKEISRLRASSKPELPFWASIHFSNGVLEFSANIIDYK